MIFVLQEKIEPEVGQAFVEAVNKAEPTEVINIYLNSAGGNIFTMQMILSIINSDPHERFILIGLGDIQSAAFELFFRAKCTKSLLLGTVGMFHRSYAGMDITSSGRPKTADGRSIVEWLKITEGYDLDFMQNCVNFTTEEIEKYMNDEDVYFMPSRMEELLEGNLKLLNSPSY